MFESCVVHDSKRFFWLAPILLWGLGCLACGMFTGSFTSANDVKVTDPVQTVAEARQLILAQQQTNHGDPIFVEPRDLPESLRIPGLRYALVSGDHIDLILARNPDWEVGPGSGASTRLRNTGTS